MVKLIKHLLHYNLINCILISLQNKIMIKKKNYAKSKFYLPKHVNKNHKIFKIKDINGFFKHFS